ncbi:Uma2 family endonuclease [[Actinomadura] parvosata]|uniref:Uma2 family endonuclease n=1 Tax=[Actinomadura] parvosata TaxID=1955412 RepID=UPI001E5A8261|nr:Uma2 family endonuclease [Nonomuraea sp. ATCC 55076]
MSPVGSPEHSWRAADLHDALFPLRKERGWSGSPQGPSICIEGPRDSFSPDYVLTPPDCSRWGDELLSSGVIMAAEVVSPTSTLADRVTKPRLYALGRVPVYLLIDPIAEPPAVTVYSNIQDGKYCTTTSVALGKRIHLPSPIDFELDTSMIRV